MLDYLQQFLDSASLVVGDDILFMGALVFGVFVFSVFSDIILLIVRRK